MFGLNIEERATAVRFWGARAIFQPDYGNCIDLLPDRQSSENLERNAESQPFIQWLDVRGLPKLREIATSLTRSDDREVVVRDWKYIIRANPRASHGYLYIGAAELPVTDKGVGTGDLSHCRLLEVGGEVVKWSNPELPPNVGEDIAVRTNWGTCGGQVVGYAVEHGYLNALTRLFEPPKQWVAQNYNRAVEKIDRELQKGVSRVPVTHRERTDHLRRLGLYPKREGLQKAAQEPMWVAGVDLPKPAPAAV